jgi:cytidylate kinase
MIITLSGEPGSGKTSVGKALAEKLGFSYHSVGEIMDEIAARRHVSVTELQKLAEKDKEIDREADEKQKKLLASDDNIIMDSRLGFFFMPSSIKILLLVNENKAAKRIFSQKRESEKENSTFEETLKNIHERRESELTRYKKYYNINVYDPISFDLVIETTEQTVDETLNIILDHIEKSVSQ